MKLTIIILSLVLLSMLTAAGVWYFTANRPSQPTNSPEIKNTNIFNSINATITGQVTGINNKVIRIKNSQDISGDFVLSDNFTLTNSNLSAVDSPAIPTAAEIKTNEDVIVSLIWNKDHLEVTNITYPLQSVDYPVPPPTNEISTPRILTASESAASITPPKP